MDLPCKVDLLNKDKDLLKVHLDKAHLNNVKDPHQALPTKAHPKEEVDPPVVAHPQATTSLEIHWLEAELETELARHKKLRHAQKVHNTHSEDQDKILDHVSKHEHTRTNTLLSTLTW